MSKKIVIRRQKIETEIVDANEAGIALAGGDASAQAEFLLGVADGVKLWPKGNSGVNVQAREVVKNIPPDRIDEIVKILQAVLRWTK